MSVCSFNSQLCFGAFQKASSLLSKSYLERTRKEKLWTTRELIFKKLSHWYSKPIAYWHKKLQADRMCFVSRLRS